MTAKLYVNTTVNGEPVEFLCDPRQSLLECLRDILNLTGTKEGCNDGNCGACSVLLNGRLVNSCLVLGVEADGQEVTTIEGLADQNGLHPLQQAFIENDGLQCGFCTPGMLIASKALLDQNPDPSEREIRTFLAGNLCRCTGYDKIVRSVQDAAGRLRGDAPHVSGRDESNIVLANQIYKVVGTRPLRHDSADKVTGKAVFTGDVRLPGMLYGKILRSPHAHARILSIDTSKAEALPGVKAVITAADMWAMDGDEAENNKADQSLRYFRERYLASDKVLFVGHAVAAVAATDHFVAEEALDLIDVQYEVLPPVMDVQEAMKDSSPLLHDDLYTDSLGAMSETPSNVAKHIRYLMGDPEKGFAESDLVVEQEYHLPTVHQGYIETKIATASWGAGDTVRIWCSTQGNFVARSEISRALNHLQSKIVMLPTETGGAFGGKIESYLEPVVALLSRQAGRPVTLAMTRQELLHASGPTPGCYMKAKIGVTRDGRIQAVSGYLAYEAGCFPGSNMGSGAECLFGVYDVPNGQVDAYDVVVNKPKSEAYRAPCVPQAAFAAETLIDIVCEKLDMDPLAFRLKNIARKGTRQLNGLVHPQVGFAETIEAAMAHPHLTAPLEGPNRGRGIGGGWWPNYGGASTCSLKVNSDGSVGLATGSTDLQGTRTSISMQAAEVLGIHVEDISPIVTDTNSTGYNGTAGGSRITFSTGIAAIEAAQKIIAEMCRRAAMAWQVDPETVSYQDQVFTTTADPTLTLTFKEVAAAQLSTGGSIFASSAVSPTAAGSALSVHIADVEVDPETGKVDVLRYTVVQDAGKAIHPSFVEGQLQGGAAQGIGYALYEGYQYDENGHLRNDTLQDNRLPTMLDLPMIDTVIVEVPNPGHPFGVRGVGEPPIVPPLATIANAVYHATGKRMQSLPLLPARILEKLEVIE